MALFKQKNKNTEKQGASDVISITNRSSEDVLLRPCLTEKTVALDNNDNVFTFFVDIRVNKFMVKNAVKDLYNVVPTKVNIVNSRPAKRVVGRSGRKKHVSGFKKAYVYLKKGDSINIS